MNDVGAAKDRFLWMERGQWLACAKQRDTVLTICVFDPIVRLFLPAIMRLPVTPNMVTAVRFFIVAAGSTAAFALGRPAAGAGLFLLWYFLDCVDGKLARAKRLASVFGDWFNGTTDRLGVGAILVGEGWYFQSHGNSYGLAACMGFLALWQLGVTSMLMLQFMRMDEAAAGGRPQGKMNESDVGFISRWDAWTGARRLIQFVFDDVEGLMLAIAVAGFARSIWLLVAAGALMASQKTIATAIFWARRR